VGVIGPDRYDINRSMALKRRLQRDLALADAAAAYAALFSAERGPADIATLPLTGLRDHARAQGEVYHEVMPSRRLTLPMSRIVGQPPAADFDAHGRTLFVAAVKDATVVSRSNLVQVPDAVLYDCQDEELASMTPEFACDGQGFAFQDGRLTLVRWGAPAMVLDEAISLLGCGSMNFGHWTGEFLYRLMLIDSLGLAPGLPVLVDAGMPASHGQALRWFTAGSRPVIEVAPACSVQVRRLWLASTPSYTPFVPRAGTPILTERLCAQTTAVADLLARQRYPEDPPGSPRRVYLDRGPALKRRVAGDDALRDLLNTHGFVRVQLEALGFIEQLQIVRGASHLVGPAGSALLFAFLFGRPGQKILNLHPPALDETPSLTSIAAARGVDVEVLMGTPLPGTPPGARNADFSIDLAAVRQVLAGWWPAGDAAVLR
jgi:capsular polysaccharide biosynthesis protein